MARIAEVSKTFLSRCQGLIGLSPAEAVGSHLDSAIYDWITVMTDEGSLLGEGPTTYDRGMIS